MKFKTLKDLNAVTENEVTDAVRWLTQLSLMGMRYVLSSPNPDDLAKFVCSCTEAAAVENQDPADMAGDDIANLWTLAFGLAYESKLRYDGGEIREEGENLVHAQKFGYAVLNELNKAARAAIYTNAVKFGLSPDYIDKPIASFVLAIGFAMGAEHYTKEHPDERDDK